MQPLQYTYTHIQTSATTGYFSCEPENLDFGQSEKLGKALAASKAMKRFEATPNDTFLRDVLLRMMLNLPTEELTDMWPNPWQQRPVLAALVASVALIRPSEGEAAVQKSLQETLTPDVLIELVARSGLPLPGWGLRKNRKALQQWNRIFTANITQHRILPHPQEEEPPLPAALRLVSLPPVQGETVAALCHRFRANPTETLIPPQETAALALERLMDINAIAGMEMRHTGSLAPVALFRPWELDLSVQSGLLEYTLRGQGVSWGRGFSIADARVSYAMEIVERFSAYVSVKDNKVLDRLHPTHLIHARFSQLDNALDPNSLVPGLAYHDQPLYWMNGHDSKGETVLVPLQAVALFCNVDEPDLTLQPVSTGLASGSTLEQAKRAALLEAIERDTEAITPYTGLHTPADFSSVFTLTTRDPHLGALLEAYKKEKIAIYFRELHNAFGVPCFECFVLGTDGNVVRATAAGLSAKRALLSALTETPWSFPVGSPSAPQVPGIMQRAYEDLPDYSTGSCANDVALLEEVLSGHGYSPVYAVLTHQVLQFPVVRALIPHFERNTDNDPWSRPSLRLVQHYLSLFEEQ